MLRNREEVPNHHVKAPFKHSVRTPSSRQRAVSPSSELKRDTLWASRQLTNIMFSNVQPTRDDGPSSAPGKLQKGRLLPLSIVHATGPTMSQCRGIVSARSRTLERRKYLMSTLLNSQYPRPQPTPRVSIESDVSDTRRGDPESDHRAGADKGISEFHRPTSRSAEDSEKPSETTHEDQTKSILKDTSNSKDIDLSCLRFSETVSSKRPVSALDPRKSVRFVEEPTIEVISARGRAKSAMPRLPSSETGKSGNRSSCKPADLSFWSGNHDDGDDDRNGDKATIGRAAGFDFLTTTAYSNSANAASGDSGRQAFDGGQGKRYSTDTAVNTHNKAGSAASTVRNQFMAWDDVKKPKSYAPLVLNGIRPASATKGVKGQMQCDFNFTRRRTRLCESARPGSATRGKIFKGRPASAREMYRGAQWQLAEDKQKIYSWTFHKTSSGTWKGTALPRRPMSGVCFTNTAREFNVSSPQQTGNGLAVQGDGVKRIVKADTCGRCKKMSQEHLRLRRLGGVLLCDSCFTLTDRESRVRLRERLLTSIKQEEGSELSGEPINIDEYVMNLEKDLSSRGEPTENQQLQTENKERDFCGTLESLVRSLDAVQADLRASMAPNEQTKQPEVDEVVSTGDPDQGYSSDREEGVNCATLGDGEPIKSTQILGVKLWRPGSARPQSGRPQFSPETKNTSNSLDRLGDNHSDSETTSGDGDGSHTAQAANREEIFTGSADETESGGSAASSSAHGDGAPSDAETGGGFSATLTTRFPAQCFRLNSRAPPQHVYYFAYGLNMNYDRMCTCVKRDVEHRLWGLLFGFQLAFNKKGVDVEAGGFPNLQFCSSSSVEGVLYLLKEQEVKLIDSNMGYPEHYAHALLPVWMCNSERPDLHGLAQFCVPALVYIAQEHFTHKGEVPLQCEYAVDQCVKAAEDILTQEYTQHLRSLAQPSHPD